MKTQRLYTAFSCLFFLVSCVENEIKIFDVTIAIQPQGSARIEPEVYGPLFPGDSLSITISAAEGYRFKQWTGTVNSFEKIITIYGTNSAKSCCPCLFSAYSLTL